MKKKPIAFLSVLILLFLLTSCDGFSNFSFFNPAAPEVSDAETTLPADYTPNAPAQPLTITPTIPPPPTFIPTPTITPTPTRTPSATPTPRIYVPAGAGTPFFDMGFPPIELENIRSLTPVWQAMRPEIRQAVPSGDGQKLFISTSNGLFVFNKAGQPVAHWRDIFTHATSCQSCLTVNQDGSLFAVLTRQAERWEVQVYEVQEDKWKTLRLTIPLAVSYQEQKNNGLVLLSPDSQYLAYASEGFPLRVLNLQNGQPALDNSKPLSDPQFSADNALFAVRDGRNLLIYETLAWDKPASLLLPANDTPFALSPDVKSLAIAFANRLRIYNLEDLKVIREMTQPDGKTRQWELSFLNENLLQGVSTAWNANHTQATITTAEWDILSGSPLRFDSLETDSPSPFPPSWEQNYPLEDSTNGLSLSEYRGFRYISNDMLLVNTTNAACWIKVFSGEQNCFEDEEHFVFSSDTIAFKEVVSNNRTLLQDWHDETLWDVYGDYRVRAVDRSGNWVLIDVRGAAADLYGKGRTRASESVGGAFQFLTDTRTLFAYTTQQKSKIFVITVIEKTEGKTLAQKKDTFLLKPLLLNKQDALLLLKRDLDKGLTIVQIMEPPSYNIREVARLAFQADIEMMAYSTKEDLLAFALADGSVAVYSPDLELHEVFQAFDSAVTSLSFSPDDRFLAAASHEGIKIFAVKP